MGSMLGNARAPSLHAAHRKLVNAGLLAASASDARVKKRAERLVLHHFLSVSRRRISMTDGRGGTLQSLPMGGERKIPKHVSETVGVGETRQQRHCKEAGA